jgi:hypothetical protein
MKKKFIEIRKSNMPPGEHVYDKKIKGSLLMIHKEKGNFIVYIDNEKLDSYSSLGMAKKAGTEFIKQVK